MYYQGRRLSDNETIGQVLEVTVPSRATNTGDLIIMRIEHDLIGFAPSHPLLLSSFEVILHWVDSSANARSYTTTANLATTSGQLKHSVRDSGVVERGSEFGFLVEGSDRPTWDNTLILSEIIELDVTPLKPVHLTLISNTHLEISKGNFELKFVSEEVLHPIYIECTLNRPFEVIYNDLFAQLRFLHIIADSAVLKLYYDNTKIDVTEGNLATLGLTEETLRVLNNVVIMSYSIREQWEKSNHHDRQHHNHTGTIADDNSSITSHQGNQMDDETSHPMESTTRERDTTLSPIALDQSGFTPMKVPSPIDTVDIPEEEEEEMDLVAKHPLPSIAHSAQLPDDFTTNNSLTYSLTSHDNEGRIISMYCQPSSVDLSQTDDNNASNHSSPAPPPSQPQSDLLDYYDDGRTLERTVSLSSLERNPSDYFVPVVLPFKLTYKDETLLLDISDVIVVPGTEPYALISPRSIHKVKRFLDLNSCPRIEVIPDSLKSNDELQRTNGSTTSSFVRMSSDSPSLAQEEHESRTDIPTPTTVEEIVNDNPPPPEVAELDPPVVPPVNYFAIVINDIRNISAGIIGSAIIWYFIGVNLNVDVWQLVLVYLIFLVMHVSVYFTKYIDTLAANDNLSTMQKALLAYLRLIHTIVSIPSSMATPLINFACYERLDYQRVIDQIEGNLVILFKHRLREMAGNFVLFVLVMFTSLQERITREFVSRQILEAGYVKYEIRKLKASPKWELAIEEKDIYRKLIDVCEVGSNVTAERQKEYQYLIGYLILCHGILNPSGKAIEEWIRLVGLADAKLGEELRNVYNNPDGYEKVNNVIEESELISRGETHSTGAEARVEIEAVTDENL